MPDNPTAPAAAVEAYRPQPIVYEDSPRVEYVTCDCPVWHDRVDGWLSLIRDMATNEIVGACIDLPKSALPHLAAPAGDVAELVEAFDGKAQSWGYVYAECTDFEGKAEGAYIEAKASLFASIAALEAERDEARRDMGAWGYYSDEAKQTARDAYQDAIARTTKAEAERDALAERLRKAESLVRQRDRLAESSRTFWVRAAKAALAGNASELRNRVAMAEAPPAEVVLSEALTQASAPETGDAS